MRARTAAVALGLLAAGCRGPAGERYRERAAAAPAPAAHAVHGERLAEIMRGMDRLWSERLPRALDVEAARAERVVLLAEVAGAVAASAGEIAGVARGLGLDAAARGRFEAHAAALRARAERLRDDAPRLSDEGLRARAAEIESTCDGCHAQFRIPR
jgi:cytochrome c556